VATSSDCYLPVYWSTTITSNTIHAGFFHYPAGRVQGDTSMSEDSASQAFFDNSATYDRMVNRWLPVASAFTNRGLFLSQVALNRGGASPSGLFLLDPGGGTPSPVAGADRTLDQNGWQIQGANAWGVDFASGGGHISGNRVLSLDLETGAVRVWKTWAEDVLAVVLGLDDQHDPIVGAFASSSAGAATRSGLNGLQVWTFTSPEVGTLVYQTTDPIATLPGRPAFSDTHAAWLGGNSPPSSVWRLASGHMVRVPVPVAGSGWVGVGGQCL